MYSFIYSHHWVCWHLTLGNIPKYFPIRATHLSTGGRHLLQRGRIQQEFAFRLRVAGVEVEVQVEVQVQVSDVTPPFDTAPLATVHLVSSWSFTCSTATRRWLPQFMDPRTRQPRHNAC